MIPPMMSALETFTILTTTATDVIGEVHDRMPITLGSRRLAGLARSRREGTGRPAVAADAQHGEVAAGSNVCRCSAPISTSPILTPGKKIWVLPGFPWVACPVKDAGQEGDSMRDVELYQQILGLSSPWTVDGVALDVEERRVDVCVVHAAGRAVAVSAL